MDLQNLQTASHYVNNLLLSRGLLRNGVAIEFANPSKGGGGKEATMAKIINLVHDMVLRRDRESDTLTACSQTINTMRYASAQQAHAISRLETKNADLERQISLASSQERSAKSSLKVAESRNRALREDMNKLKITVGQIRAQCANDVRKRDAEISRLKKYLDGRRGRDASNPVGITVVTPGVTGSKSNSHSSQGVANPESPSYSLKEESTEFLMQLSQSLSDENDTMINLLQSTLTTLRGLQGLSQKQSDVCEQGMGLGDTNVIANVPPTYETLATDMDEVLEHLRSLLTNPSFVPLEEVEVREEEIMRLREGWEKMETRWHEAISLMNSWRKRMMESGDTINLDDLRKGLNLDSDNIDAVPTRKTESRSSTVSDESSISQHSLEEEESKFEQELAANKVSPVKEKVQSVFPAPSVLQSTSGNARRSLSPRKATYKAKFPETGALLDNLSDGDDIALLDDLVGVDSPTPLKKRKSQDLGSTLTVQEKLQKAEEEAAKANEARRVSESKKKPVKRTAIPRKTKSKRRSTLSPEELEGLMGIS